MHRQTLVVCLAMAASPLPAAGQRGITRAQAIEAAVTKGSRLAIAAADTAVARAGLIGARSLQDPSFSADYSKSAPQLHFTIDWPVDLPGLRKARISSASAAVRAASYRLQFEKAAAALDADTTYTRAQALLAHARLSRRNAFVADTLLQMAITRRNAGDASDLEVELARVNAGQEHNAAVADSIDLTSSLIDLQAAMGIITPEPDVFPSDSLVLSSSSSVTSPGQPLLVAAGRASVQAAEQALSAERRAALGSPSVMGGIETHDPEGAEKGILPTFGISVPIPLFNRNRGAIAQARAEVARASAELTVAQIDQAANVLRMERQRESAYARAARDRTLLQSAERVASMSITAYRAGAFALSNVLEAQRASRDILRQYIDDVADALIADAALRVLNLTTNR